MDEHLIEVIYRDGVFRPLETVDLEEGKKCTIIVKRYELSTYHGVFGKASATGLERLEEEIFI